MANAHAETEATEKSIKELLILTKSNEGGVEMMLMTLPNIKRLTPEIPEPFWTEFLKEMTPSNIMAFTIPVYQKNFSEEEIQAMINFYRTPVGQKVLQKTPQVLKEVLIAGQQWGKGSGLKVYKKMYAGRFVKR